MDLPDGVQRIHADRRQPGAFEAALRDRRDDFDVFFDNTAFTPDDVSPMVELFRDRLAHYVFTSSQAVYRRSFVLPIREDFARHSPADDDPRKAYGVGKVRCEDLLLEVHERTGFPATCLRVGHTMGPRSPAPTRDPIFFARLETGRPVLVPGDGFAVTQFVHINDVARCMTALMGNERVKGEAYNVSGREVASILGVVHLVARAMGVNPEIVYVPQEIARQATPIPTRGTRRKVGSTTPSTSVPKMPCLLDWMPAGRREREATGKL
ncbi:MAG: NAD-dependent epimerase/dehydratase family protein [Pseudomonadales bacterium]